RSFGSLRWSECCAKFSLSSTHLDGRSSERLDFSPNGRGGLSPDRVSGTSSCRNDRGGWSRIGQALELSASQSPTFRRRDRLHPRSCAAVKVGSSYQRGPGV